MIKTVPPSDWLCSNSQQGVMHEIKEEETRTEIVVSKTAVIKTICRCPQRFPIMKCK